MSHLPPSYNPPPLPPPMPVQVLGVLPYTAPETNARPGVITAIGVISICVGGVGMIWGMFASFMTFALFVASTGMGRIPSPPTPDMAGPNGFNLPDRQVVVRALDLKQSLTPAQQEHLHWFLADVGTVYFPQVPAPSTGTDVAVDFGDANITDSSTDVEGGKRTFDITMGKLTVTDTDVSIKLAKDGTTVTRSATRQMPNSADPSQLSPAEIGMLVGRIQEMGGTGVTLSAAQLATLNTEIQTNAAGLLASPKDVPAMMTQLTSVTSASGNVYVQFQNGLIILTPTGPASTSVFNTTATSQGNPGPQMLPTPSVTLIIESVLSVGLSIYLLVIGILTLRNTPLGSRLHKIYAWLKILLTLIAAGALAWVITAGGGTPAWGVLWACMMLIAGILYPVILLCVLRIKSVRQWYTVEHLAA